MKKNLLNHYVVDLLNSMEQHISEFVKSKKSESLHHLRVDIKKIRAAFYFAENLYKEEYSVNKLKPIFVKAGHIREIQINILLLGLMSPPPLKLIEPLKEKENKLTLQFIKCSLRYARLIKNFRKNVSLPGVLPDNKSIIKYFKKEKQKANEKIENKDRESLHRYRMKIKKLMYMYNVMPKKMQKEIELNHSVINKLQQKLGDWHDTYAAVKFLSDGHFPDKLDEYFVKLKLKEKRQFNALLRSLTNNPI